MKSKILTVLLLMLTVFAVPTFAQSDYTVHATAQRFERGLMIWRSDTAHIWVLTDTGSVFNFPVSHYGRLPNRSITGIPLQPINGFGKVWDNFASVRAAVGLPIMAELGYNMRIVQWNGITYLQQLDGTIYQINPNNTWVRAPGMPVIAPPAAITGFDVQPLLVSPGSTITVSWSLSSASLARLQVWDTATSAVIDTINQLPPVGTTQLVISPAIVGNAGIILTRGDVFDPLPRAEIVVNVQRSADHSVYTSAAFQQYESGFMIWRSDTGTVYTFSGASGGYFYAYPQNVLDSLADNPFGAAPANRVRPINGFGRVWGGFEWVRQSLGWATAPEQTYTALIVSAQGTPVSFALPNGRTAHVTSSGMWALQ